MVWIHGGAFTIGSAFEYEVEEICRNLVSRDVIVVSIQYRLWVYGFLASGDEASLGNYGLHDQILALKWIHENIGNFGGDPDKITIFGESAGGASVSLLNHFPLAAPYYAQVIAQSGSAAAQWAISDKLTSFNKLAKTIGCVGIGDKISKAGQVNCLREKSANEISKAHIEAFGNIFVPMKLKEPGKTYQGGGHGVVSMAGLWGPTIDGDLIPAGGWPKMTPSTKPFITGTTEQEQISAVKAPPTFRDFFPKPNENQLTSIIENDDDIVYETFEDNIQEAIFIMKNPEKRDKFNITKVSAKKKSVLLAAEFAYITSQGSKENKTLLARQLVQLASDMMSNVPSILEADKTKKAGAPTWLYSMDYYRSIDWPEEAEWKAAAHGSDIPLLFTRISKLLPIAFDKNDDKMRQMMCKMWTDFSNHGTPESEAIPWPQFESADRPVHLKIKLEPEVSEDYHRKTVSFWTSLFPKMTRKEKKQGKENNKRQKEL